MGSLITGFWKSATFYCKHHPDTPMVLKQGGYSPYYGCVHEFDDQNPCHNRLNLIDAEKALQKLMDVITKATFGSDLINMKNYKFVKNGIEYKVVYHDPMNDTISIMIDNRKIMRG